jgi:N-acetylmuramoyl-L-alanine amidase
VLLLTAPSAEDKRVSIYTASAAYSLPVVDRDGQQYVSLLEALEPLGKLNARLDGNTWKLRFNQIDAEFKPGKNEGRVRGAKVRMEGPLFFENNRGLIPLASLPTLLARFLNVEVKSHPAARRLFVGNVATHFRSEVRNDALVVTFTAPVNPVISTEPGKLRMTFLREPVISDNEVIKFDGAPASSLSYVESNGRAELTVTGSVPLMATFANGGRTIRVAAAPGPAAQVTAPTFPAVAPAAQQPVPELQPGSPVAVLPSPPSTTTFPSPPAYLVVLDASHGGEERGAALAADLAEKDVTLALARQLRNELQQRGIATMMLRDGDLTLTAEQRAAMTSSAHPALFISIHAGSSGPAVRIFTAMLESSDAIPAAFLRWDSAQSAFTSASRVAAGEVQKRLAAKDVPSQVLSAAIRPLNNIAAAAFAIEVGPPKAKPESLLAADYQQQLASAVATAVINLRPRIAEAR